MEDDEVFEVDGSTNKESEVQDGRGEEVLLGLDAVGLYPSITTEVSTKLCSEAAEKS